MLWCNRQFKSVWNEKVRLLLCSLQTLLELVNTSAGINKLLFAGKERMALRADFNTDHAALSRTGGNFFAASALDYGFTILRMDSGLHFFDTSILNNLVDVLTK